MKNEAKTTYLVRREESFLSSLKRKLQMAFMPPTRLPLPQIAPDIEELPLLERITETLRYVLFSIEYSLSPNGGLRQWLKVNLAFFLLLGIPILIFAPLFTFFMVQFTSMTVYLLKSVINILFSLLVIIVTASLALVTYKLAVFLRDRERQTRKKQQEEYERIEQEIRQKREEELRRFEAESQKRREEEYRRIEMEAQRRREEEHCRIEAEIRKKHEAAQQKIKEEQQEELERFRQDIHQRREEEQQRIEAELQRKQEEELRKFDAELQEMRDDERQKFVREARRKISEWQARLHIYDQQCESPIEQQFWNIAKHRLLGLLPQYEIGRYRVDFALPDEHLVIELDGHDYHKTKEQRTTDAKRERDLKELGWYVIRFTGTEIYRDVEKCVEQVERILFNKRD